MNRMFQIIRRIIKDPKQTFFSMNEHGFFFFFPDKPFLKLMWWAETGKRLNLKNPKGFNEKLQWLKLYDRHPEYTRYADKLQVRNFVRDTIGEEHLVPLIGVWDRAEDIDFDSLPDRFVLKCNHNSGGGMCICTDKSKLDIPGVVDGLNAALKKSAFYDKREWAYKYITPKILCEKYLVDKTPGNTTGTLIGYDFYCFDGEPRFLYVRTDDISGGRKGEASMTFYDLDWKVPPFSRPDHAQVPFAVEKPECFDEMIDIARKLSKGIPFVRVDLYWVDNRILFSEMTLYPGGGNGFFSPPEWEEKIGEWIMLPDKQARA